MSYILDALRKADAQRERDPARGIHARPLATLPGLEKPGMKTWQWGAIAAAVLVVAVAGWQWFTPAAPEVAAVVPTVMPPAIAQAPAPVVLPAPVPVPEAAPAPREERKPSPAAAAAAPARAAQAPASTASAAAPADARILPAAELPPDMPKLAISGGVYSDNPSQRMLIVNGQVVNEGAELAPGMVLEQIRAKSAVLRVRGLRYGVPY